MKKELKELVKKAGEQGWRVEVLKSGHLMFYPPDKTQSPVTTGGTISDHRGLQNAKSMLKKRGMTFDGLSALDRVKPLQLRAVARTDQWSQSVNVHVWKGDEGWRIKVGTWDALWPTFEELQQAAITGHLTVWENVPVNTSREHRLCELHFDPESIGKLSALLDERVEQGLSGLGALILGSEQTANKSWPNFILDASMDGLPCKVGGVWRKVGGFYLIGHQQRAGYTGQHLLGWHGIESLRRFIETGVLPKELQDDPTITADAVDLMALGIWLDGLLESGVIH